MTRNDPLTEIQGVLTRDLVELGGLPERLALPLAEFAAVSVALHWSRTQQYFPEAAVCQYRNRKLRELHRRALANVAELGTLTSMSKAQLYRVLARKTR